jgi:autotransporter passenger strand-loop-strand repeat protein
VDLGSDEGVKVDSGARATSTTAAQGGLLSVLGSAVHAVIESGGAEIVSSGGVVADDTVQSGGTLYLLSGATASHETVLSSGGLVFAGDLTSNFTLPSVTGTTSRVELDGVTVSSGGLIELADATLLSGVTLSLASGALAFDLTVSKGAVLLGPGEVQADSEVAGSVSGVTLDGEMDLSSGARANGVAILEGGLRVESGATATGTLVSAYDLVFDSGSVAATVVSSGGEVEVYSGGVASGDIISSGGAEGVLAGGTASAALVSSGGVAFVSSGGTASGDEVLSGGLARIYAGGNAVGLTISGGGEATISSGGTASGLVLDSGGHVIDNGKLRYAGSGTLSGILSGSGAIVEATSGVLRFSDKGAAFSGQVAIEGGTVELATSGAIGTGYVDFSEPATGSAVLQIDAADAPEAGGTFANAIHNFSGAHEAIDLRSIAFVAGASATIVGSTLVLTDGGKTYLFNIAGNTADAYPVLSDGHGGTLIDPKAVAFAHTAAAFAPSDAAKTALVSSASPTAPTPFAHAMASAGRS